MKSIIVISLLFASVCYGQTDSTAETEWQTIYGTLAADDTIWEFGVPLNVKDTLLIPAVYRKIELQFRESSKGVIQQRQRYYLK